MICGIAFVNWVAKLGKGFCLMSYVGEDRGGLYKASTMDERRK